MLGRKPCVAGIDGGRDPAMGRTAAAGGASSRQNTSFAQHRTLRRQSGVGKTASRLPQDSYRKLWLSVIDRVLRATCRPTLQISAPVNPESLSIQTCGRRTSSDHVNRIEWKGGRCRGVTWGTL